MSWLYYMLEANLYLCLFYAGYQLLFSRETYYTANRAYLLAACTVAFIIPFLQLGFLKPVQQITQVVLAAQVNYAPAGAETAFPFSWEQAVTAVYLLGVTVSSGLFGIKIYKLSRIIRSNKTLSEGDYKVVYLDENNTAFSFFNYLFIGKNMPGADIITRHELVHINQKHSADIVFLELIKAVNWFNPLIYLLQNSLKTLHEYIADAHTASADNNPLGYSTFLLNNAYGLQGLAPANSFFNYNLLKKRIIMLNQKRSGSLAGLKYLLAVPLCGAMLCTSTLSFSKDYGFVDLLPNAENHALPADTLPKKKVADEAAKITEVRLLPPPKVTNVKILPPPKVAVKHYPPPVVNIALANKKTKFPPPVLKNIKIAPTSQITEVKILPPPANTKADYQGVEIQSSDVKEVSIKTKSEKAKPSQSVNKKNVVEEIRIEEPVKIQLKSDTANKNK